MENKYIELARKEIEKTSNISYNTVMSLKILRVDYFFSQNSKKILGYKKIEVDRVVYFIGQKK